MGPSAPRWAAMMTIMMSVRPGMGQGDEGRVDDRNEEDTEDAEGEEEVEEGVGMGAQPDSGYDGGRARGGCPVVRCRRSLQSCGG